MRTCGAHRPRGRCTRRSVERDGEGQGIRVDLMLWLTAALMGLAGAPHCAAMCGAACVVTVGRARGAPMWGFQLARMASYSAAGAVAAASVQVLGQLGQWTPLLKPLWIAVHAA